MQGRHIERVRTGLIGLGLIAALAMSACAKADRSEQAKSPAAAPPQGAALTEPATAADSPDLAPADFEAAVAGTDPQAIEKLLAKLPRFSDDQGHEYYILEGDLPSTEEGVRAAIYAERAKRTGKMSAIVQPELKLEIYSPGKRTYWLRGERTLTYAVDKASFADAPAGAYDAVVANIAKAAAQWEGLCPACGLTIRRRPELDTAVDPTKVTFVVRYSDSVSSDIALAFFPASPSDQHTLWVFARYPVTTFDKVGVFRHELGHVLGYAHEHLDKLSGCAKTSDQWQPITPYDPKSAMHYVCGSEGSAKLAFTDCDQKGHLRIYGAAAGVTPPTTPPIKCDGVPLA
jgi:hypothetical protein